MPETTRGRGVSQFGNSQADQFVEEVTTAMERANRRLRDLDDREIRNFEAHARDISTLQDDVADTRNMIDRRFRAVVNEYSGASAGGYKGSFASRQDAENFGKLMIALQKNDNNSLGELHGAAISSSTGESGGALLLDTVQTGIVRNVEKYGVFERNARRVPMASQSGALIKRTDGFNIEYPDIETDANDQEPSFAKIQFNLTRYVALSLVQNNMLRDTLAVPLAEFIAEEFAQALANATDANAFIGDGSAAYARNVGLADLNSGITTVTADSGDDTFPEVVAKSTEYLAAVAGQLASWAENQSPKWYMSRAVFFSYWGVRDTTGQPITDVLTSPSGPMLMLMGYPVEITQVMPTMADSAASKVMLLLGALSGAAALATDQSDMEIAVSPDYRFARDQTAFRLVSRRDIGLIDAEGVVGLKTAAS